MNDFEEYIRQGEPQKEKKAMLGKPLSACRRWMI